VDEPTTGRPDRLDRRCTLPAVQRSSLPLDEWHYIGDNEIVGV
jgi:hypothetical protein